MLCDIDIGMLVALTERSWRVARSRGLCAAGTLFRSCFRAAENNFLSRSPEDAGVLPFRAPFPIMDRVRLEICSDTDRLVSHPSFVFQASAILQFSRRSSDFAEACKRLCWVELDILFEADRFSAVPCLDCSSRVMAVPNLSGKVKGREGGFVSVLSWLSSADGESCSLEFEFRRERRKIEDRPLDDLGRSAFALELLLELLTGCLLVKRREDLS